MTPSRLVNSAAGGRRAGMRWMIPAYVGKANMSDGRFWGAKIRVPEKVQSLAMDATPLVRCAICATTPHSAPPLASKAAHSDWPISRRITDEVHAAPRPPLEYLQPIWGMSSRDWTAMHVLPSLSPRRTHTGTPCCRGCMLASYCCRSRPRASSMDPKYANIKCAHLPGCSPGHEPGWLSLT